jgi:toxin-antitoxin system PIN domain toxin
VLLADVNVFLYAHRPESARHPDYLTWLQQALLGPEPFGVSEAVLASFVRIATHHRVYVEPSPSDIALAFCDAVRSASATVVVQPGEDHWGLFSQLVLDAGARGNLVPDAYLAALAIEQGATFVTTDRGFARYPGLRQAHPLEPHAG